MSRSWAAGQLGLAHDNPRQRLAVIAGRAGLKLPDKGSLLCSCFEIGANQIQTAAAAGCLTVESIGKAFKAGTKCGSCRGEIRNILNKQQLIAAE